MAKNELLARIEELNEYEKMIEELRTEAETIKDELKAEMEARETEQLRRKIYYRKMAKLRQLMLLMLRLLSMKELRMVCI